jgi:hypothetical protein
MSVGSDKMDGMLENKVEHTVYRTEIERMFNRDFTDKEWEVIASEIEGIFIYYVEKDLPDIIDNLEYLVEQDSKYD